MNSDPETFNEAVARFREFLRGLGVSGELIWIEPEDLLLAGSRRCFVRLSKAKKSKLQILRCAQDDARSRAREVFVSRTDTDTGVELRVIGFAREGLCCCLVKRAQAGVKFSCPAEESRVEAVGVRSAFRWRMLRRSFRDGQEMRRWLFEE